MNKKIVVVFQKRDEWLYNCLEKIVKSKREMGLKTSISFELIRWARNGFINNTEGMRLDRELLGDITERST